MYWHVSRPYTDITSGPPKPTTGDARGSEDDDGNNIGVIVGVVVSLLVIFIVGGVVVVLAVIYWHYHNSQDDYDIAPVQSEVTPSGGPNGTAHRPKNIPLHSSSNTPLLNHAGSNAYTNEGPPQQIEGAPMPYGNASNGISNDLHQNAEEDVKDDDLDETIIQTTAEL